MIVAVSNAPLRKRRPKNVYAPGEAWKQIADGANSPQRQQINNSRHRELFGVGGEIVSAFAVAEVAE